MQKGIVFFFLLLFSIVSTAQYTEIINSRRPGFSDSPYGVGTNVLQVEGGIFYGNKSEVRSKLKSLGTDFMVRYGKLFEGLEVDLNISLQNDKASYFDQSYREDVSRFGLTQLSLGAKYLVYNSKYNDKTKEIRSWKKSNGFDLRRLIPSVGVYAGFNIPITKEYVGGNFDRFIKNDFSPRIAIYMQNDFTKKIIFVSNLIMDKLGTDHKENSYILTTTYSISEKWNVFAEHQGIFKSNTPDDYQFGGGVAYLISPNMQVDISARNINDRDGSAFVAGGGFSWRLDKHKDAVIFRDADGKIIKKDKKEGNLFSRLFKKKSKKKRKVKSIGKKKKKVKDLKIKNTKEQKAKMKAEKKAVKRKRKGKEPKSDKKKEKPKGRKKKMKGYKQNVKPTDDDDND